MAVAIVMEFEGGTLDQYDQVIEKMGLQPRGPSAPDSLFHWVAETDNGILVTDVWESQEAFDRFSEEQIGPYTQEAGIPAPPKVTVHQVHSYLKTPS